LKKASAPQRQRANSAPASIRTALWLSAAAAATLVLAARSPVRAYPLAPAPRPHASAQTTPQPTGNVLPFDSNLTFVIDESISSKSSKRGEIIGVRLKNPLVVGGRTIAPEGTPAKLRIVDVSPADIGDVYGFVDIFFEPLQLPDGRTVPLRAPIARLAPHDSSGHESTVELEDTIEDEVIPYHFLYHIFRKGKNFVLGAGSQIPARTEATITALPNGTVAIETPRPMRPELQMPKSTFPSQPYATPFGSGADQGGGYHSRPYRGPHPSASPSGSPSPSASAAPSGAPSPAVSPSPTGTPWPTPEPPTPTPSP
jgi:hypothetical protein